MFDSSVEAVIDKELKNSTRRDIDDTATSQSEISKLSPKASNIEIINKINEIINEFNKTLISNRI